MVAVGTITETRTSPERDVQKIILDWTCSGAGAVSGIFSEGLIGRIVRVTTDPTDGPTDDYDVVFLDEDGVDLFAGLGANRDTTNTETVYPLLGAGADVPSVICGRGELQVAAAGVSKSGRVILYLARP